MKKIFYLLTLTLTLFTLSCGDDDSKNEPTPHEIGIWDLDGYVITNVPAAYSRQEGLLYDLDDLTFGGSVIESYRLTLNTDGTYLRKIGRPGPDLDDEGTWTLDDDNFKLESKDGPTQDWKVVKNENDDLRLSEETSFALLPNNISDTVTQAWLNTLSNDEFSALLDRVNIDFVYAFERKTD